MLFQTLAEEWINFHSHEVGINTIKGTKNVLLNHCLPFLIDMNINDIKYKHLQNIINSKRTELSKRSIKQIRDELSLMFKYAIKNEYANTNVAALIDIPKNLRVSTRRCLTTQEELYLLNFDHDFNVFPLMLYYTGIRRGEALALTWADIDHVNSIINIEKTLIFDGNHSIIKPPKTKNGYRKIPIPLKFNRMLEIYKSRFSLIKSVYVFPQKTSAQRHSKTSFSRAYNYWHDAFSDFIRIHGDEPKRITSHMFRHTYASILVENDVDELMIQYLMGHANINFTMQQYVSLRSIPKNTKEFNRVRDIFTQKKEDVQKIS